MDITVEQLAHALAIVGPSEIEQMAWSPLWQRQGDDAELDDDHDLVDDPYPMASLARAIFLQLDADRPVYHEPTEC